MTCLFVFSFSFSLPQLILPVCVHTGLLSPAPGSGAAALSNSALLSFPPPLCFCHQDGSNWSGTCMVYMGYVQNACAQKINTLIFNSKHLIRTMYGRHFIVVSIYSLASLKFESLQPINLATHVVQSRCVANRLYNYSLLSIFGISLRLSGS